MQTLTHCPICGAEFGSARRVHTRRADAIFRCGRCGSLLASPRPEPDELDDLYRREYYGAGRGRTARAAVQEDAAGLHRTILRVLRKRCPAVMRPGSRVLDYGCGLGFFLAEAKAAGLVPASIELSEAAAEHARTRLALDVQTGAEDALAHLPDGEYQLVTAFEMLEHVLEPRKTLRLLVEKLAAGGVLAVSYPNLKCWRYRLQGGRWFNMANPTHLNFFSLRGLRGLIEGLGLAGVTRVVYYGGRSGFGPVRSGLQYLVRALNLGSNVRVFATRPTARGSKA